MFIVLDDFVEQSTQETKLKVSSIKSNRELSEEIKIGRYLFAEEYHSKPAEFGETEVFFNEQRFM
jgi:hypothetical protein